MITFLYWLTGYLFVGASISYGLWEYAKVHPEILVGMTDISQKEFYAMGTLCWLPLMIMALVLRDEK